MSTCAGFYYSEDVKFVCILVLLYIMPSSAEGQHAGGGFPQFQDYAVGNVFNGRPAKPRLVTSRDERFRTRIREAAAQGPNFAGHYTIGEWGCGSGCISIVLINAMTGEIHTTPFNELFWGMPIMKYETKYAPNDEGFNPLAYTRQSRLLIVRGCPEGRNCASYFYEWTGSTFKLLRKVPPVPVSKH